MAPRHVFAAAALVAALALLEGAQARRMALGASAAARRAALVPASSGRRTPTAARGDQKAISARHRALVVPVAVLLHSLGQPQVGAAQMPVDHVVQRLFGQLDADGDDRISGREFMAWLPRDADEARRLHYASVFAQADIDDDDHLTIAEFEFAGFIANEAAVEHHHRALESGMPEGFRQNIKSMFDDLRQRHGARIRERHFADALNTMLRRSYGEHLDAWTRERLRELYDRADVIKDGKLNYNELDFFECLLEDAMIRSVARNREALEAEARNERADKLLEALLREMDENADGKLEEAEVVRGVRKAFDIQAASAKTIDESVAMIEASERFIVHVREEFKKCDANGDGSLDVSEVIGLVDFLESIVDRR